VVVALAEQVLRESRVALGSGRIHLEEVDRVGRVRPGVTGRTEAQALPLIGGQVHEAAGEVVADLMDGGHPCAGPLGALRRVGRVLGVAGAGDPAEAVAAERVRNHHPVADVLCRVGRPPAHHGRAQAGCRNDVPDRCRAPVVAFHRRAAAVSVVHQEPADAVVRGLLTGGDAGPDRRRQGDVVQGLELGPHPALPEPAQVRQLARGHQLVDHPPVRTVDAHDYHPGVDGPVGLTTRAGNEGRRDRKCNDQGVAGQVVHQG